jgi:hypothetical protein
MSLLGVPLMVIAAKVAAASGLVHAPSMVHHCGVTQRKYAGNPIFRE